MSDDADEVVGEPPVRDSHLTNASPASPGEAALPHGSAVSIDPEPARFPDDGNVSRIVRKIDHAVGSAEQGLLFGLLALVVVVAAAAALSDKVGHHQLGRWWHYIVRGGTFSIAMFGAVFATYQQRHLAMDLISRNLTPKGRLILGTALKLFTIFIAYLLFHSGMKQREVVGGTEDLSVFGIFTLNDADIVTTMPIAAAMIIFHSLLHIIIDVDYLARGKTPPERMRAH